MSTGAASGSARLQHAVDLCRLERHARKAVRRAGAQAAGDAQLAHDGLRQAGDGGRRGRHAGDALQAGQQRERLHVHKVAEQHVHRQRAQRLRRATAPLAAGQPMRSQGATA